MARCGRAAVGAGDAGGEPGTLYDAWDRASYAMTLRQQRDGKDLTPDDAVDPMEIAAHGGSFPIQIEGVSVVGAITISGVPGRRDHGFAIEAICGHLGIDYAPLALPPQ
ncbi:MAG: heme-binding protein [Devosia sp.]